MKNILFLLILITGFFANAAVQTQLANKVIVGTASSSDKTIEFNAGLGTANPKIKVSVTNKKLQTSVDGVTFKDLNEYSGVQEINLLENAGFENDTTGYTFVGGTAVYSIETGSDVISGNKSLSIIFNGSGQYFETSLVAIPKKMQGSPNCLAKVSYTTAAAGSNYLTVYNQSGSAVGGNLTLSGSSFLTTTNLNPTDLFARFTCPTSGSIKLRMTTASTSPVHIFDDLFLGLSAVPLNINPTIQKFTSGSGTYTTPLNVKYIKVKMVGPGGGGAGSSTQAADNYGVGGAGSAATTFGTALLSAGAGGGAGGPGSGAGGTGGSASISAPAFGTSIGGGAGSNAVASAVQISGSVGAVSPFGGAGKAGVFNSGAGGSAVSNSGSGGGGAGSPTSGVAGGSGGAGGYVEAFIAGPLSSSYSYSVGSGGTGGTAGTSGAAGGAGASGIIIVEEYYQ